MSKAGTEVRVILNEKRKLDSSLPTLWGSWTTMSRSAVESLNPQVLLRTYDKVPPTVHLLPYIYKGYDHESIDRLNELIDAGPFEVHLGNTFSLDQVADAHRALESHYWAG
jgi:hypothetical protein